MDTYPSGRRSHGWIRGEHKLALDSSAKYDEDSNTSEFGHRFAEKLPNSSINGAGGRFMKWVVAYLYFHQRLGPRELSLVVVSPFSTSGTHGSLGPGSATFEVDVVEPVERDRTC